MMLLLVPAEARTSILHGRIFSFRTFPDRQDFVDMRKIGDADGV